MKEGDEIDLGGRTFMAVEPVIRDLRTTYWGFDTKERVLFPGDGFAYSHYHEDGHCGLVAEEAVSLDLPDVSSTFADLALFWTKFADMNVYCDRLDHLIARLGVKIDRTDPRPADHRREDDGAESAGRVEGRSADAGIRDERKGLDGRGGVGLQPAAACCTDAFSASRPMTTFITAKPNAGFWK